MWLVFALAGPIIVALLRVGGERAPGARDAVEVLLAALLGVAVFVGGIAFARGCRWLSRGDIDVLTAVIGQALSREPAPPPVPDRQR